MISVANINGSPEQWHNTPFGHHSDISSFYFFESDNERNQFLANLFSGWSKEAHAQQINEAHNALFTQLYTERNYLSIGEIPLWVSDTEFGTEAQALITWWVDTCKIVADYLEAVTEETSVSVETFINQLPKID